MKYILNSNDQKELQKLIETNEINIEVSNMYVDFLNVIKDADNEENIQDFLDSPSYYYNYLLASLGLDSKDEFIAHIQKRYQLANISALNIARYKANPFMRYIKWEPKHLEHIHFVFLHNYAYEAFTYDDTRVDNQDYYKELTSLGFFEENYKYYAIAKNDITWMCITPHEINTMQPSINAANGNVLVLGLGLGYYPYMISLKEDVESVTIVENDQEIIDLFVRNILPQFKYKNKIHNISKDAFTFIKESFIKYDYQFADLWHNPEDGIEMYLKLKNIESKGLATSYSYWIENSLLCFMRRSIITMIDEETQGSTDKQYIQAQNISDKLINSLHFALKEKVMKNYQEIFQLLSNSSLQLIASKLIIK